ncbi:MAG TPA: VWA domain-containing protein [Candidatus Acidoferrum sp.]|nr:VWA domain-containing protein [Candidatus Acidoferrum sp.]
MPKPSSCTMALKTIAAWLGVAALVSRLAAPVVAQTPSGLPAPAQLTPPAPQPQQEVSPIRVNSELVLVNVVARDKKGNLVRDLKKEDFSLFEDNKTQRISTFDFENVDALQTAGAADATVTGTVAQGSLLRSTEQGTLQARDRRLMVLFFDFSSMEPEEIDRAVDAAKKFISTKMQPADLIAVVSLASNLQVNLDFSDDRSKLQWVLTAFSSGQGQGFDNGTTGSAEGAAETGGSFTADDTDYNTFNADRKLIALQSVMKTLGVIPQKKSIIFFSNGITQQGVDNQSALRAATAAAVKANVSIYPMDIRGLQALPPGGEAQSASLHGVSAYSGASIVNDLSANASSQDTLSTLASDTGGKAFFDSNDFTGVFSQVQKDSSAYYVLGFTSGNPAKDGKFRHLRVQINRPDIKLEYRSGYYAGRDFVHSNRADREQQLDDELASELPQTDVALYAGAAYFRQDDSHYQLLVSLVVPGSQIPFVQQKDRDSATIDIIGEVRVEGKIRVGQLRDTVKLALDTSQQVRRKNVQYNTSFLLAPGSYHLKFVVRENQNGRMGSFETDVQVPDLRKVPLKMSSVVLASQRAPATTKKNASKLLVQDQSELVPNITHVFTQDQHLYMHYEIYDAAKSKGTTARPAAEQAAGNGQPAPAKPQHGGVRVLSSIEFLQKGVKVYETKPLAASEVTAPDRKAVVFQIDIPLQALKPGFYTCQVNVIDDVAATFAFPRWPILIKAPVLATPPADATTGK